MNREVARRMDAMERMIARERQLERYWEERYKKLRKRFGLMQTDDISTAFQATTFVLSNQGKISKEEKA